MELNDTYEIIGEIGKGTGGIVYKARHKRLQKDVVIKQTLDSVKDIIDNRQEVDLLKKLKHSYLPQVLDFFERDDKIYTVMDFIDGKNLDKIIAENKRLKQRDVIKYAIQLCQAVEYLHKQNPPIIHRDIKPANIMLTASGDICLIDFNVSYLFGTNFNIIAGTPPFASPEQMGETNFRLGDIENNGKSKMQKKNTQIDDKATVFMPNNDETVLKSNYDEETVLKNTANNDKVDFPATSPVIVDARSDIYSIGATLYCMLTGCEPILKNKRFTPIAEYKLKASAGLIHIIEKAMSYAPEKRYHNVSEILKALNNVSKTDKRYRMLQLRRYIATAVLCVGMFFFVELARSGYERMLVEREEKYNDYIAQIDELIDEEDYSEALSLADTAQKYMPERINAYYSEAKILYNQNEYEECINYIKAIETNSVVAAQKNNGIIRSNLFFTAGNAAYELEDYITAIDFYNKSMIADDTNTDCYRDLAICYARTNNIQKAGEILDKAIAAELSNDQIYLINGEINNANGKYNEACEMFEKSAAEGENDYLIFRAIVSLERIVKDNAAEIDGSYNRAINMLLQYKETIAHEYKPIITELLANEYTYLGDAEDNKELLLKAANYYWEIIQNGSMKYVVYKNCIELQYRLERYEFALMGLSAMNSAFPNDYWVMMEYSYCHIEIQNKQKQEQRDYSEAYNYYQKAAELYSEYSKNGKTDANMQLLDNYIEQLIEAGWIEV